MRLYKEKWGFPTCLDAIDGTHIPIQAPHVNRSHYINGKSYHSILMQALMDSKYLFRDVVMVGQAVSMMLGAVQLRAS